MITLESYLMIYLQAMYIWTLIQELQKDLFCYFGVNLNIHSIIFHGYLYYNFTSWGEVTIERAKSLVDCNETLYFYYFEKPPIIIYNKLS
jgi:hypothetical protein